MGDKKIEGATHTTGPKDEKERVKEVVPPDQALEDSRDEDVPVTPAPVAPAIKCGYYIGITEAGDFKFDIVGSNQNIADLLGLHAIAEEKLNSILDKTEGGKFSTIIGQLSHMHEKLDQSTTVLAELLNALSNQEEEKTK